MMSNTPTKEQLLKAIARINKAQKGEVFSAPVLAKILGTPKKLTALSKSELCQVLATWKEMLSACPHSGNWVSIPVSNRIISLTAGGVRWVDYFGFPSRQSAESFLTKILPHCKWALVRQSGKRVNASFECKVWGLEADEFQEIAAQERPISAPPIALYLGQMVS